MVDVVEVLERTPLVGDCYRAKRDVAYSAGEIIREGNLAIVMEARDDGRIAWVTPELASERVVKISDPESFVRDWQWVPDADEALRAKVDEAMRAVTEMGALSASARAEIGTVDPHVVMEQGAAGGALVPVVADIARMRSQIGKVRNDVAKLSLDLKKRQSVLKGWMKLQRKRMEALLKAQMDALTAKVGDLNEFIAKAEEAIWTINIYLGKDEEIVQIKKGKPAPKDAKISVRQRVLFADEECAISAEEGGIDHMSIKAFDEWLAVPANRRQVLPEEKGVVVFKPRRRRKDYGSSSPEAAWVNAAHEKANKKTYFLMANGENLYRVCTELEVTSTLIPTENEVSDLFFETKRDYDTGEQRREPVYPGDKKYMEAMEAATDLKKHYLRILLFLQGLLDRTVVFAPLPAPRLNLLDRRVYADYLHFITDAEKLLPDGRVSFEDWLFAINSRLDVGHRIMGAFHSWTNGLRQFNMERHGGNERLSPPRASFPEDLALYTIEGNEHGLWFFRYVRKGETVWRQSTRFNHQESGEAKRRASCRVSPTDDFILNYDEAKVEDMEFYLQDRTNRQSYAEMFPLLKKAIEMKRLEAKEEEPFKDLLVRKIAETYDVVASKVSGDVGDLISWWKLKNRTHRALLSDDAKAFRMIVAEYGRRASQEESFDRADAERFADSLSDRDDVLLVAYNRDGNYVVLRPSGKEDVYVREEEWSWLRGEAEMVVSKPWQVVERKRLLTWKVVRESERWSKWKVDARASDYLTDDERRSLVDSVRKEVLKKVADRAEWRYASTKGIKPNVQGVLCVKFARRNEETLRGEVISFYVWRNVGIEPDNVLTGRWQSPEVEKVDVTWEKKRGVVKPNVNYTTSTYDPMHLSRLVEVFRPWGDKGEVYEEDEALMRRFDLDVRLHRIASARADVWRELVTVVVSQAQEAMSAEILEREKAKFLAEYEHEELWEEHLKSARVEKAERSHRLFAVVSFLLETYLRRGARPSVARLMDLLEGRTFEDLFAEARRLGWKSNKKKDDDDDDAVEHLRARRLEDEGKADEASVPMGARVSFDGETRDGLLKDEREARESWRDPG